MSDQTPGYVSLTIIAGTINATGNGNEATGYQLQMAGAVNFIHITPKTAAQWIDALTPIAKEAK